MAARKVKSKKPGRNDPCWCGSGKKYKDCHLPIEDELRARQRKLRQAQDTLMAKITEATEQVMDELHAAFATFWNEKYTPDQMDDLDDLENHGAQRFLTWFAFDYPLETQEGRTLVATLAAAADAGGFEVDELEAELLPTWVDVRLRPYQALEVRKGTGMTVRDLLTDAVYVVEEHSASRYIEVDEVLVGHVVPVGVEVGETLQTEPMPRYYVAGSMARLTSDTQEKIVEFATLHLEDLRRVQPDATLNDMPQQRSYILNHFVMELPEEHVPGFLEEFLLKTRTALSLAGVPLPGGGTASDDDDDDDDDKPDNSRG